MASQDSREHLPDGHVLIAGGGPVGLLLALVLAYHGQPSVLLEQNMKATRYPKMHLVIARSMEIFKRLGLAEELRSLVRFSSGLNSEQTISSWDLPSAADFQEKIKSQNDGTMPREAWQRIPSNIMEPWLRKKCDQNALIDTRYGWKVQEILEHKDSVDVTAFVTELDQSRSLRCSFAVGCDGAWSPIRKSLGIEMEGGPMYVEQIHLHGHRAVALVHFRSTDLKNLHCQGKFWHTFFPTDPTTHNGSVGGAIIAQDGEQTWTVHDYLGSDYNPDEITAEKTIARVLGGMGNPFPIVIDEVFATSIFTPTVALAKSWSGPHRRVFLAGDACHQTIPSGGYGMNMGLADAWDLGWKLAATCQGWGGRRLVDSYEVERRPVAALMQHWSKIHMMKLMGLASAVKLDATIIDVPDKRGASLRREIDDYVQLHDDHNQSFGVEMGHRYESDLNFFSTQKDFDHPRPEFDSRNYTPSTYPGYRAPHVFLSDGKALYEYLGKGFTLIAFANNDADVNDVRKVFSSFEWAAKTCGIPLQTRCLMNEPHASDVWGSSLVLVRPDDFVVWRTNRMKIDVAGAARVLLHVTGHETPNE
ncbi:hypothetical protein D6C92_09372 [Aureobasidium pullulans]|nr:hypothetical protein D6C92_09372 [Aureobasidium pullulans]